MELLEQIMALEPAERRALAEEVLLRTEESEEDAELLELAEVRWQAFEARGGVGMSHEEMMVRLATERWKNPSAWVSHGELMKSLGR